MEADKEVLPYSYKIEGVNNIKGPKEEELVVDCRRRRERWLSQRPAARCISN